MLINNHIFHENGFSLSTHPLLIEMYVRSPAISMKNMPMRFIDFLYSTLLHAVNFPEGKKNSCYYLTNKTRVFQPGIKRYASYTADPVHSISSYGSHCNE